MQSKQQFKAISSNENIFIAIASAKAKTMMKQKTLWRILEPVCNFFYMDRFKSCNLPWKVLLFASDEKFRPFVKTLWNIFCIQEGKVRNDSYGHVQLLTTILTRQFYSCFSFTFSVNKFVSQGMIYAKKFSL